MEKIYRICVRATVCLLIIFFMNFSIGCHYYKAKTVVPKKIYVQGEHGGNLKTFLTGPAQVSDQLSQFKEGTYVVIHQGEKVWHLQGMTFDKEKDVMLGVLEVVEPAYQDYIDAMEKGNIARYKKRNAEHVLTQAHVYISDYATAGGNAVIIPVDSITKIDVYKKAVAVTTVSYILPGLLMAAAGSLIFLGVISSGD